MAAPDARGNTSDRSLVYCAARNTRGNGELRMVSDPGPAAAMVGGAGEIHARAAIRGMAVQVGNQLDPALKALVFQRFDCLKLHPFQAIGFKCKLAPPTPWFARSSSHRSSVRSQASHAGAIGELAQRPDAEPPRAPEVRRRRFRLNTSRHQLDPR